MNRVRIELAPPPWGKSFLSFWSSTEPAPNQNENRVGLQSVSLTSCWNKFPYIRSCPERFSPSKPSSNPSLHLSRRHTIVLLSVLSQPPRKDHRSLPPPLETSHSVTQAWGRKVATACRPHWPPPPQGRQNELAWGPSLVRHCCGGRAPPLGRWRRRASVPVRPIKSWLQIHRWTTLI
jgi:hypothetical protein